MAANPQCLPSTLSAQTRTVKRKAAAGATHSPASTQRASAVAEQGLGVAISAPTLMLGVHQWLPEESVRCADHSQGTPSNHHAASGSQQSHGKLDADLQSFSPGQDSIDAAVSIHGAEAASVPMRTVFSDGADSTQAGCAHQQQQHVYD
ncbi:TPA: hypothetical protein ACH3X2_011613 [Trebouxia sp. C0005]